MRQRSSSIATEWIGISVPRLITWACYAHEERRGDRDTFRAHDRGGQAIWTAADDAWNAVQAALGRRDAQQVRN
jgi:hypothetical protein